MRRIRFPRSMMARLVAFYLVLFTLSVGAVLGVIYWFTAGFIDRHTVQSISLEVEELEARWRSQGYVGLLRLISERSALSRSGMFYAVATPSGDIIAGNLAEWPEMTHDAEWIGFALRRANDSGPDQPVIARIIALGSLGKMLVGQDITDRLLLRDQILSGLAWAVSLAALVGTLGAALMGRSVTRRINALNQTVDRITAGAFADRMPIVGSGDELDRLAEKMNVMLDRIGLLMQGLRDVTDNVAHDLRTPLARLRARLEQLAIDDTDDPPRRQALEAALAETDRLLTVFAAMLSIASVESGRGRSDFAPVDLAKIAVDAVDFFTPLAEEQRMILALQAPEPAFVTGNAQLLAQALSNLLDNALKYTPEDGCIQVTVTVNPEIKDVVLTVSDNGPGIPLNQRDRVLDRFVRLEAHRGTPGHGLGLSLVSAVARLHGAALTLIDADDDADTDAENRRGLKVSLSFPPLAVSAKAS